VGNQRENNTPTPTAPGALRNRALDGLRGVSALVVVVHHALLTIPVFAGAYYDQGGEMPRGSAEWLFTYTPLHILWAGTEAVYVFFILSGIVLLMPVLRAEKFDWIYYYPQRLIRLYVPIIAAVLFGLLLVLTITRTNDPQLGAWMVARPDEYSPVGVARDFVLIAGTTYVVSPLWSLQWEVLFSVALPLYVMFCVKALDAWWWKLILVFGVVIAGSWLELSALFYLSIFAVGALLVVRWKDIERVAAKVSAVPWAWPLIFVVGVLLTCVRWELGALGMADSDARRFAWIAVIGCTILVLVAAFWRPARKILEGRVALWLGTVSFSLYLVHEPILIATRFLTADQSPWVGLALSIPLSFLVGWVFTRAVEMPAHRLSKKVGLAITRTVKSRLPSPLP
jgi:peptidoglycan/LPS O-acetylase OafA/YrhL